MAAAALRKPPIPQVRQTQLFINGQWVAHAELGERGLDPYLETKTVTVSLE